MKQTARSWRVTVAGLAVGAAGVLGLASPTASADPVFPPRPVPRTDPRPRTAGDRRDPRRPGQRHAGPGAAGRARRRSAVVAAHRRHRR